MILTISWYPTSSFLEYLFCLIFISFLFTIKWRKAILFFPALLSIFLAYLIKFQFFFNDIYNYVLS